MLAVFCIERHVQDFLTSDFISAMMKSFVHVKYRCLSFSRVEEVETTWQLIED